MPHGMKYDTTDANAMEVLDQISTRTVDIIGFAVLHQMKHEWDLIISSRFCEANESQSVSNLTGHKSVCAFICTN